MSSGLFYRADGTRCSFDELVADIQQHIDTYRAAVEKAHALIEDIGADAVATALRERGWVVREHEDD